MKKIIALLLAAVMCLCLTACGGGEKPDGSLGLTQPPESTTAEPTANAATLPPLWDHPLAYRMYGEWVLEEKSRDRQMEQVPCSALTLNADGTCIVDGTAGSWQAGSGSTDTFLRIDVYINGEHKLCVGFYDRSDAIGVWSVGYTGPVAYWTRVAAQQAQN